MKNSEKVNQILSWYQHENNNVKKISKDYSIQAI